MPDQDGLLVVERRHKPDEIGAAIGVANGYEPRGQRLHILVVPALHRRIEAVDVVFLGLGRIEAEPAERGGNGRVLAGRIDDAVVETHRLRAAEDAARAAFRAIERDDIARFIRAVGTAPDTGAADAALADADDRDAAFLGRLQNGLVAARRHHAHGPVGIAHGYLKRHSQISFCSGGFHANFGPPPRPRHRAIR